MSSEEFGIDLEGEVAVVTDDVPMGATPAVAGETIRLVMLVNDVSLRNLIPAELAKGFGFFHGKPSTAFSAVAVTPFLKFGDRVRIEMFDAAGKSIFGAIDQTVVRA